MMHDHHDSMLSTAKGRCHYRCDYRVPILLLLAFAVALSSAWHVPPTLHLRRRSSCSALIVVHSTHHQAMLEDEAGTPPQEAAAASMFQNNYEFKYKFDRFEFEKEYGEINPTRWKEFVRTSAPLVSEIARLWAVGKLRRDDKALAVACRETLTNLGPTFIKLGQILSVREDVLGVVWSTELAKLQDSVVPFDGQEALRQAREAFGPDAARFASLDEEPVAAASLAQVHRGRWRLSSNNNNNMTEHSHSPVIVDVAVKVLRPGVANQVAADLCVLLRAGDLFADWAPRVLPESRVDWRRLLEGLAGGLWEECNLKGEAERQEAFGNNMRSVPRVFVPKVIASTQNVMVSEWVTGIPLRAIPPMDSRLKKAQALMRDAYCQSMFIDAFFHADCHGGNILWVPAAPVVPNNNTARNYDSKSNDNGAGDGDDRLCILDCGLMVAIEPAASEGLLRLSLHLAARDWTRVVNDAIDLKFLPKDLSDTDFNQARGIARRILGPYLDVGGGARAASAYSASALLNDVSSAARDLPFSLPPDMVLLGRAVIQLEGLALRAYPNYRLVEDILPVAVRIALRTTTPISRTREDGRNAVLGGARESFLYDLLYDNYDDGNDDDDDANNPIYRGTAAEIEGAPSSSFAPRKLRSLLATARGGSGSTSFPASSISGTSSMPLEELIDELLQASAVRDIIARETVNIVDAMGRDALWKGVDTLMEALPSFPKLLNPLNLPVLPLSRRTFESLAPRLSEEEQLVLLRLPKLLGELATAESNVGDSFARPGGRELVGWLGDDMASAIPGINKGLRKVVERALVEKDPNARETVDAVAQNLRKLLEGRLEEVRVPGDLARRIANAAFQTPW